MSVPPLPSRGQLRKASRPYATNLGELVFAWNDLHETLSHLFELAIKSPSRQVGVSIWHSTDSDYAQRKMLRAAVKRATHFTASQRNDILWVLDRIDDKLRHSRNDMIHAPYSFIQSVSDARVLIVPAFNSDSPRAKALWAKARNLKDHFDETRKLADVLGDYAGAMFKAILNPSELSWPKRPALPQAHRKKSRKG